MKLMPKSAVERGEAYWTLRSRSTPLEIKEGLLVLRDIAEVPSALEVSLVEAVTPELKPLLDRLTTEGFSGTSYLVRGRLSGAKNRETAKHLGAMATTLCDWDTISPDAPPFHQYQEVGDFYVRAGNRWVEVV